MGKRFEGNCDAAPDYQIPPDLLRHGCNLGYARDRCDFAKQSQSDATTFVIAGVEGPKILIRWALERDHLPVAVGEFEVAGRPAANPIEAQAAAYVSIYRERLS